MTSVAKRETLYTWLLLAAIGLLAQAFWAARLHHPTYMDAYYYATNGQRLAAGEGFTEMVIWQFLDEPGDLPIASHTYWMPLPSILAAAGYKLTGNFRGAQAPFWLLAGLLPLLTYVISRQLANERWQAWTAALITAAGGFYAVYWNQPETFIPFAWAGALCLLYLVWAQEDGRIHYWLLAGVTAGLAHLTRADGVLLLVVVVVIWVSTLKSQKLEVESEALRIHWLRPASHLLAVGVGYLLVMGGWFVRNWLVMGRPLSTVGTQTLFLTTYDDLFAYGRVISMADFLAWGGGNIAQSKLAALSVAGQTFLAVTGLIFLTPFIATAWWILRRRPDKGLALRPLTGYTFLLFAAMSLLFTFPGVRGGLFHSTAALWPWFTALAVAGLGLVIDWLAVRRPRWRAEQAKRVYAGMFVLLAFAMSMVVGLQRGLGVEEAAAYRRLATLLPPEAVVMAGNAPGFHYHSGRAAVSVPNEPPEILLQAARQYGVTHLVLDAGYPRPLASLYQGLISIPGIQLIDSFDDVKLYELIHEERELR